MGMGAALVSAMLLLYGLSNVIGNVISGRTLGSAPYITMIMGPIALVVLYSALFIAETQVVFVISIVIILGVVVGIANTTDQFMVSRSAPDAPDFINGLFLTTTNLGTTIGTSVCGMFISEMGISFSVWGTLPCLILGFVFVLLRMKCVDVGRLK